MSESEFYLLLELTSPLFGTTLRPIFHGLAEEGQIGRLRDLVEQYRQSAWDRQPAWTKSVRTVYLGYEERVLIRRADECTEVQRIDWDDQLRMPTHTRMDEDLIRFAHAAARELGIERIPKEARPSSRLAVVEISAAGQSGFLVDGWCQPNRTLDPQGSEGPQRVSAGGEDAVAKPEPEFCFRRDGDGWFIRAFGKEGHFQNLKGFEYIAKLLDCPGKPVPMAELIGAGDAKAVDTLRTLSTADVPQPVLDDDARHSIRRQLKELAADIARAEENHEYTEADVLRNEFQRLSEHEKATTTPRGKTTRFRNATDRMRWRISKALTRAYRTLRKGEMHDLAAHLETYIEAEGDCFAYSPSSAPPWVI